MKFRLWPNKKPEPPRQPSPYQGLVKHLISQVSSPTQASSIIREAQDFLRLPVDKQNEEIVCIYLAFEQYCCNLDEAHRSRHHDFRSQVLGQFPQLLKNEWGRLPFFTETESKLLLLSWFYQLILTPLLEVAGHRKGSNMETLWQWCRSIWDENFETQLQVNGFPTLPPDTDEINTKKISRLIFSALSRQFSILNLENLYHKAYQRCFNLFRDYEHFHFIILLIPSQFLKLEHLRILGKTQMEQVLLENIHTLEETNNRLHSQIHENQSLSQNLQEQYMAFEKLLANPLDCIIVVDENNRILSWNTKANEIFNYSAEEVQGKKLQDIIIPYSRENEMIHHLRHYTSNLRNKLLDKTLKVELWNAQHQTFPAEMNIKDYRQEGKLRFVIFIRDISERKAYEDSLVAARKAAEEANQYKSRFFANMSHEIRTPLNAIIGFTELMLKDELSNEQAEYLRMIQSSGKNLMSLINDILDLSKIEAGELRINPSTEDFSERINEIIAPYVTMAEQKGLKFTLNFEEAFPRFIQMDYYRYNQVLVNLLGNAIKFTDEGEIRVRINYRFNEKGQCIVKTTVSDSGKGIQKEKLKTIFHSFQQESHQIEAQFGGTGLGLSISKEIALLMGGDIIGNSPSVIFRNRGCDFIFSVTVQVDYQHQPEKQVTRTGESPQLDHLKVLLAEDNPVNQMLLSRVLDRYNLNVILASNGQEALDLLKEGVFDLVFMDINMPEMDGYATAKAIRNDLKLEIPIIAVSANVYPEDKEKSIASGMQAHIGKPFNPDELIQLIQKLVDEPNSLPTGG